ncbi:MAG: outer membrane lipoprotein-sorting protein, partial [Candidatus Neomarinimicrobiota bacterium]
SWVRQSDHLPIREENYNRAGRLEKTRVIQTRELQGYSVISRIFVQNHLKNHTTELQFDEIQVDTGVKENLFHERNLRRLP